jgi:hypothetical protein
MSLPSETQEKSDEESANKHDGKECNAGEQKTLERLALAKVEGPKGKHAPVDSQSLYYAAHGSNTYKLCFESSAELAPLFADLLRRRKDLMILDCDQKEKEKQ